ncbi:hypothetical protein Misp01_45740 [Microtetraspora sp. NBRC 13810]|nr:hypothetical protein Misp01_45740 [Microtetraspora sp. NBRC 13810]
MALGAVSVGTAASPTANTGAANTAAGSGGATATSSATTSVAIPLVTAKPSKTADPAPKRADYAGRVKAGGLMAVSVRDGKVVGYFCDGRTEAWFTGKAQGGQATLRGFGGAKVTTTLGDGGAKGRLSLGGKRYDFSAPSVKKPSGLYRASTVVRGARIRAGWIVLPNGDQVGFAASGDTQVPTPVLRPGTDPTIDGTRVAAKDVDEFIGELS